MIEVLPLLLIYLKMMALYWGMKFFFGKPQNEKFSTFLLHEGEWSPQATKMTFNVWLFLTQSYHISEE